MHVLGVDVRRYKKLLASGVYGKTAERMLLEEALRGNAPDKGEAFGAAA